MTDEPQTQATERADANEDAAMVWRRRAYDMKDRLDAIVGGSAEWVDVTERVARRQREGTRND